MMTEDNRSHQLKGRIDSSRNLCAVCHHPMPVTRFGLIHVHGPVSDHCPGTRNPPAHELSLPLSHLSHLQPESAHS